MAILLLSAQSCQNKTEMQSTNQNQIKMENSAEKASIENVLNSYGDALNTADVSKVLQYIHRTEYLCLLPFLPLQERSN